MTQAEAPDSTYRLAAAAIRARHGIETGQPEPVPVWRQLSAMPQWLNRVRDACADSPPHAAKASEWLLDNEFHVRRAIRQVREDLPATFYFRLPRLAAPEYGGMPRAMALAQGMLDAGHMQVSLAGTVEFVLAYQQDGPLTIAELWAFPALLRLACLETLIYAFTKLLPDLAPPFGLTPPLTPRETPDPTEAVSRAISALLAVSNTSWKAFFEQVSHVEKILREDPAGIYPAMDFETRDRYRRAVEEIADGSQLTEWDVSETALKLARAHTGARRLGHIGCWLIAERRAELERKVGFRPGWNRLLQRWLATHPGRSYAVMLAAIAITAMIIPAWMLITHHASLPAWVVGLVLSLAPAMIISVAFTNWIVTRLVAPQVLPKLDVEKGLSPGCEAALVMPVILRRVAEVATYIERLETHWLSNPDPLLRMALLSDLADADSEHAPEDALIEAALLEGVRSLNRRYADQAPFLLLHRRRRWNPAERRWMGWERKRGKLEELSNLILGHAAEAFPLREGDIGGLCRAHFVVTLDADTTAPPNSIKRLLGAIAHPLNRVEFDPATGRPYRGYTFIQPRIEILPNAGEGSLFTRLYTGDTAIDIYSRAVSDVYQDLFGEGIFTGKGAFDVAAFHRCLHDCVPENAIVSHDLFEGIHGRAALASDIVFYEDFPTNYLAYARRSFRWIRGDWQLTPWLRRTVPCRGGTSRPSLLSALDRWKIFDNLRRSLIAPALVAFAVTGWLAIPEQALTWTLLTVAAPGAYLFTDLISGLSRGRRRGAARSTLRQLADHAGRWLLAIVFLAYEAAISVEAITRTLYRVHVSRRHLLEWTSAAHSATQVPQTRLGTWREMVVAPLIASAIAILMARVDPVALPGAGPLLLLWFASPEIARFISRKRVSARETIAPEDRLYLRLIARRTWLFFETFAGPDDNWLPPDNYQASPHEEIAHRSSPTNVGMFFLSSLTAWDLGHIGLRDLSARVTAALDSLDRLESHAGHTVNWFDTKTLKSLSPRYISTVDSGNLAVSLTTLGEGCREAAKGPLLSPALWEGVHDALHMLREGLVGLPEVEQDAIGGLIDNIAARAHAVRNDSAAWRSALDEITAGELRQIQVLVAEAFSSTVKGSSHEIFIWLDRTEHHLLSMRRDIDTLQPWVKLIDATPAGLVGLEELRRALPLLDTPLERIPEKIGHARAACLSLAAQRSESRNWIADVMAALNQGDAACRELSDSLKQCASRAGARAFGMDFRPLYDGETRTFFIGYNLDSNRLDQHHYDLLASEARLASYFAIAKRDVPVEHWSHLGRPITKAAGALTTLSWNGSMFEYLMPALLLPSDAGRLLGQSERAAVATQQRYGQKFGLPWGISESGYAARDASHRYQYQAFGVPGLGLKRGLAEDYVIAPYASALALAVAPRTAVSNLRQLDKLGLRNRFGFFEAADFTPDRRPASGGFTPVRSYMAHHQGMISAAIGNALNDNIMVKRFCREPRMRATELLLQERVPWEFPPEQATEDETTAPDLARSPTPALHGWTAQDPQARQFHAIGNGSLASWITHAGGGALWWRGQALTGWMGGDVARAGDARMYISESDSGMVRTLGSYGVGDPSETTFHAHKIEFHERMDGLSISMEIAIAPGDDIEIRRVTLSNESGRTREINVTSYAEVVLAPAPAHERHPAFSKLFIHSERLEEQNALLFTRRPRRPSDSPPVVVQSLLQGDPAVTPAGFETDRRKFLGRHGNPERPPGAVEPLFGDAGWTLDPIMALRARVILAPGARAQVDFVTVAAGTRETALEVAERYATPSALDWAMEDALRSAALEAHRLGLDSRALAEAQALCTDIIFPRRPPLALAPTEETGLPAQPHLWTMGLSGDLPIILVRVIDTAHAQLLPVVIRAHQWWKKRSLRVDLVILQEGASGYQEPLRDMLIAALRDADVHEGLGGPGGIHLLAVDRFGTTERRTLEATARLSLDGAASSLAEAVKPAQQASTELPTFQPVGPPVPEPAPLAPPARPAGLGFDNSLGGFTEAEGDYLIHLENGQVTPAPWCNVLANESFGTIVSEAGLGFTWSINSGEHRLTPWSNDPVRDPQAEALYLRDEETGQIWTPTPLPAGGSATCQIHQRAGATTWTRHTHGIKQHLTVIVPPDDPVKLALLRLSNPGDRGRRFTVTYYAEWLLGAMKSTARPHVVCGFDFDSRALIARNGWNPEFADRTAFLAASRPPHSLTCNRATFLGRQGNEARPAGLMAWGLDGALSDIADPCAAFQVHVDLAAGETQEVAFVLGEGANPVDAARLAGHWTRIETVRQALAVNDAEWSRRLGAIKVKTPDLAFDLMVNRWLLNQTYASRIFARAGFQQASGAFGFRDQLQDMIALVFTEPLRLRAHILECASHQFEEGDVLHWWHPPLGRGVRTHCSDDLMWLVYATGRYVHATGDTSILYEEVSFLSAPPLGQEEEDRYALFASGTERATLFEHCRRAMDRGATTGAHGLPLIGTGDWNDGMDRVGKEGRGESLWLAWFAVICADIFAELAHDVGRGDLHDVWRARAEELRLAADGAGWDGEWYVRAFADDGLSWGSKESDECKIDSISQSWAALAGGPSPERTAIAVAAATRQLVDDDARLVKLLAPPFDRTPRDPGYIRAYPPGVRENGGQYSHAAAWLGLAHALLGDGDQAYRIFDLIHPIRRTDSLCGALLYRGEPYVTPGDVRASQPGMGQAGWTWYTGSAGWMWQLGVEGILGLSLHKGAVKIAPRLPKNWGGAEVRLQGPDGTLRITIRDPDNTGSGPVELLVDGHPLDGDSIEIPRGGIELHVTALLRPTDRAHTRQK